MDYTDVEGVIELLSHRDDCASLIVSAFVVGDCDDEAKTQREATLALVRGRGLERAFARARSSSLIRWFVQFQYGDYTSRLSSIVSAGYLRSVMWFSTLYSMSSGSSVFRALYGATGTTPAASRWSCQSSVS